MFTPGCVLTQGAKIKQADRAALLIVEKVGEIGIGLHHTPVEEFAQAEIDQLFCQSVPELWLHCGNGFDAVSLDKGHCQNAGSAQCINHLGHLKDGVIPKLLTIAAQLFRFAFVIGFIMQL